MSIKEILLLKPVFLRRIFDHIEKARKFLYFFIFNDGAQCAGRAVRRFSSPCAVTAAQCAVFFRRAPFRSRRALFKSLRAPFFCVVRDASRVVRRFSSSCAAQLSSCAVF